MIDPLDYTWEFYNSFGVQKGTLNSDPTTVIYRIQSNQYGVTAYFYDSDTVDELVVAIGLPDGVVVDGGIDVSDIGDGNIEVGIFQYRLTIGGVQQIYTSDSIQMFTGIGLSSEGLLRIVAFYGDENGNTIKAEGPEGEGTTMPVQPANTTLLGYTIVSDSGAEEPVIPEDGFALLDGGNNFTGPQVISDSRIVGKNTTFKTNRRFEFFKQSVDPSLPFPTSIPNFGFGMNDPSSENLTFERYAGGGESALRLLELMYSTGAFDFKIMPTVNGDDLVTHDYVDAGLATKLNITDYNQHFRGKFISKAALDANVFNPPLQAGDYAQVDAGAGQDVVNYNWDADDNEWIEGGSGSGATNTDMLPEGSVNLYFTNARVLATLLVGYALGTNTSISGGDSILQAFGKIQAQLNAKLTSTSGIQNQLATQQTADYNISGKGLHNVSAPITGSFTFIGDSYTAGTGATTTAQRYSSIVATTMGLTEVNLGVGGRSIQAYYAAGNNIPTKTATDRFILLELGINDRSTSGTYPSSQLATEYNTIVTWMLGKGWAPSEIILVNTNYTGAIGGTLTRQNEINAAILAASVANGTKFVDIYTDGLNNGGTSLLTDGLHPGDVGHRNIAKDVLAVAKTSFGISDQTFAANGITELQNLRVNVNSTAAPTAATLSLLATDIFGNLKSINSLPDKTVFGGDVYPAGKLISTTALVPSTTNVGDVVLPAGAGLTSAFSINNRYGRVEPFDSNGAQSYRNYYTSATAFRWFVSNGTTGAQVLGLDIQNNRELRAYGTFRMQPLTSMVSTNNSSTYTSSLNLIESSSETSLKNGSSTGGVSFYSSAVDNTPVLNTKIWPSGSITNRSAGITAESKGAAFEVDHTTKGMLIPRLTTTQRDAIIKETVSSISVTNGGSGYTNTSINFTGGGGSGLVANATLSSGVVTAVTVVNGGTGYTSDPSYSLVGGTGLVLAFTYTWKEGLMIFNTTTKRINQVVNGAWKELAYSDDLQNTNTISAAGTLTLTNAGYYTFNGSTSTWTLPPLSGNTGIRFLIMNQGSGTLTVNSNAGGNDIYMSGSAVNMITIGVGEIAVLYNNSLSWFRQL